MSGNLAEILSRPIGIDVLTPLKKWQELSQGQAQTGLIQQETEGKNLANQLSRLQLGMRSALAGPIIGGAGAPGQSGTGYLPPVASGGGGVAPGAPSGADGGSQPGQKVSPYGAVQTIYGVPLPMGQSLAVTMAADPSAALKSAMESRRTRLFELLQQPDWHQGVTQAYQEGWMDPQHYQMLLNAPQSRSAVLQGLSDPTSYMKTIEGYSGQGIKIDPRTGEPGVSAPAVAAKGALAEGEAAGRTAGETPGARKLASERAGGAAEYDQVQVIVPDPDHPGQFRVDSTQKSNVPAVYAANSGARAPTAADHVNPQVTLSPAAYSARVKGSENTSGNPGQRNTSGPGGTPTSTAMGDHQFTEPQWRDTVAAAKPAWAQGLTDAQLQAARADPDKSAQMAYALAQTNGPQLQAAGQPVNSLTLGLAHGFGAAGADAILKANPNTKMSDIVSAEVLKANPTLARQTVGQVLGDRFQKYGVNGVDLSAPWTPPGPTPSATRTIPGMPKLTPKQETAMAVQKGAYESDLKLAPELLDQDKAVQANMTRLLEAREKIEQLPQMGALGDVRARASNIVETFIKPIPGMGEAASAFIKKAARLPDAATAQELDKLMIQAAGTQERAAVGSHGSLGLTRLFLQANPNIVMQQTAGREIANLQLVQNQMEHDYLSGRIAHVANQGEYVAGKADYIPGATYDKAWSEKNNAQTYLAATELLNQKAPEKWSKGLTQEQGEEAMRIAWRADPSFVLTLPDGKKLTAPPR